MTDTNFFLLMKIDIDKIAIQNPTVLQNGAFPKILIGKNVLDEYVIASFVSADEARKKVHYLHMSPKEQLIRDFVNGWLSYADILRMANWIVLVEKNEQDTILNFKQVAFDDLLFEQLPLEAWEWYYKNPILSAELENRLQIAAQRLLYNIEIAFQNIQLDGGVSLHETIVIDNYGDDYGDKNLIKAIQNDERRDWKKLIHDPELKKVVWLGGLSFYDAKGLRFHLPAYMSVCVKVMLGEVDDGWDLMSSLNFHLTDLCEYQLNRFAILNQSQRTVVRDFLEFRLQYNSSTSDLNNELNTMLSAIQKYWAL